jgi:hypothetical protein
VGSHGGDAGKARRRCRPATVAMPAAAVQFDWPVAVAATSMTEAAV